MKPPCLLFSKLLPQFLIADCRRIYMLLGPFRDSPSWCPLRLNSPSRTHSKQLSTFLSRFCL